MPRSARVVLPAAVLLLSAVACQGEAGETQATARQAAGDASESNAMDVVYVSGSRAAEAYVQIGCAAEEFSAENGINFTVQAPDAFDPQLQIPVVNAVVANRPDAILISPTDPQALIQPLQDAADQGIAVITVGNSVSDESFLTSAVIGDNEGAGRQLAQMMAEHVGQEGGKVGLITYQPGGSAIVDARQSGFESALSSEPQLSLLEPQLVEVSETDAASTTAALLAAHPDLVGLNATFDTAQAGAATAIDERGLADQVFAVAYDATADGLANLETGVLDVIAAESFRDEAIAAMEQAVAAVSGGEVEKHVTVPSVIFTPENVDDPELQPYRLAPDCG